jgi:stalled ribosome alternative rescue factor ArfA
MPHSLLMAKTVSVQLKNIAVSYDGKWYTLVTKIQPLVTDPQFRGSSEKRMKVDGSQNRLVAQAFKGPSHRHKNSDRFE